jgi:hypothetical protein
MVRCNKCGKVLTAEYEAWPRVPCPECGATVRDFDEDAGFGGVVAGGRASAVHGRPGLKSKAEADDDGRITLKATGPSPRNEEDALQTCARLVKFLNGVGADWSDPRRGDQDIDCCSTNSAGAKLEMQVVRASTSEQFWQELNKAGSAHVDHVAGTLADELIGAIRKKASKYSPAQKKGIVLVLDATRTPSHTFQQVFDAFRAQHLEECQKAGFAQVWVVGSQDSLVERLDA